MMATLWGSFRDIDSPTEVHLGRRVSLNVEAGLEPWSSEEGKRKPAEYVRHMAQHVRATVKWVQQCRQKYNRAMRRLANKAGRKVREYKVGDQVKLQAVETKGVARKLLRLFDGPYEVLKKDSPTEYTIQNVGEGKRVKVRVRVDRLGDYNDLMEMDVRSKSAQQDDDSDKQEYEVGGDTRRQREQENRLQAVSGQVGATVQAEV